MLTLVSKRGYVKLNRDQFTQVRVAIDAAQPRRGPCAMPR
jgi:hypothetical protein